MKTNSSNRVRPLGKGNIISRKLPVKVFNSLAKTCGFVKRKTGKISPKNLIIGFMSMVSRGRNTYADWAMEIGVLEGKTITKQSLFERMQPETESYCKAVLENRLCQNSATAKTHFKGLLSEFNSIKIDDSTTLHLPDELTQYYPGNMSRGKRKSQAKIHAMYNLTENNFSFFNVHSYSNNDQSLSGNVLPYLKKGDLCIRDLGFTVLDVLSQFNEKGIYFIARKAYKTNVYEIKSGEEINLLKELKAKGFIDREVLMGKKNKIKVRLIAFSIPEKAAQQRKRKAKKDRDRRLNHSFEYYKLLRYNIFITNIDSALCDLKEIQQLYRLRWRIEIIFKSWKSCFSLEKLIHRQCKNIVRVNCIIYLMLLYIHLFHVIWWNYYESQVKTQTKKLSLIKLGYYFQNHFTEILYTQSDEKILEILKTHCCYDKRKDRENAKEILFKFAA